MHNSISIPPFEFETGSKFNVCVYRRRRFHAAIRGNFRQLFGDYIRWDRHIIPLRIDGRKGGERVAADCSLRNRTVLCADVVGWQRIEIVQNNDIN